MDLDTMVQACLDRAGVPLTDEDDVIGEATLEDGEVADLTPASYADAICASLAENLHHAAATLLEGPVAPSTLRSALRLSALGRQLQLWLSEELGSDVLLLAALGAAPGGDPACDAMIESVVDVLRENHAPPTLQPQSNPFEALAARARALESP